jgi:hypothetical protein
MQIPIPTGSLSALGDVSWSPDGTNISFLLFTQNGPGSARHRYGDASIAPTADAGRPQRHGGDRPGSAARTIAIHASTPSGSCMSLLLPTLRGRILGLS